MLRQGDTLDNGYTVIAIAGAYVMATNGMQYATDVENNFLCQN